MLDRKIIRDFCLVLGIFLSVSESMAESTSKENNSSPTQASTPPPETSQSVQKNGDPVAQACTSDPELAKLREAPASTLGPGPTNISADRSRGSQKHMILEGKVVVTQPGQSLRADRVDYKEKANQIDARGNVVLSNSTTVIKSETARKDVKGDRAELKKAEYWFHPRNARGKADQIQILDADHTKLSKASYTTCQGEKPVWKLSAKTLKLDTEKHKGHAKGVVIKIKEVPVFYFPAVSFPLNDDRKSGFLAPSFGNSDRSGQEIKVPYYWNIAPNHDATFTPRFLSERGVQLLSEYRYKFQDGEGRLGLEWLPDDKIADDSRHLFSYRHSSRLSDNWSTNINLNSASDPNYFIDLGANLTEASATQLERRVDLTYTRPYWSVVTRVQDFQPLSTVAETYQRLPQVLLSGAIPGTENQRLTYHLHAEAVQFEHELNVVKGTRLDLMPGISYRVIDHSGFYLTPKVSVRQTNYALTNNSVGSNDLDRTIPFASVDTGMFLDRQSKFFGRSYLQTLEPRFFYLYVPRENQSNYPVFDTSRLTYDIHQLFRENRYAGADRVGDANQLTMALTSRLINQNSGREKFRATLGQIFYFEDRQVTLPNEPAEFSNNSDMVAEFVWHPTLTQTLKAAAQWDSDQGNNRVSIVEYQYRHDSRHLVNLAYRFRENSIDQTDISGIWALSAHWNAIGRWNYSLRDDSTLETLAGLEYNSCCWAVRLLARSYIRDITTERDNSVHVQFVLKGLGKIGDNISSVLGQSVWGYDDTFK